MARRAESDPWIGDSNRKLWSYYLQLVAVEKAFKTLQGDLAIHPSKASEHRSATPVGQTY